MIKLWKTIKIKEKEREKQLEEEKKQSAKTIRFTELDKNSDKFQDVFG